MKNYLDFALKYHENGLKVVPFWNRPDGGKSFPADYAKYRECQTLPDVQALFSRASDGICLLCTDGIEAIDIDKKHDPKGTIVSDFVDAIEDFGIDLVGVVQKTKSGGCHIIYKCPLPSGNQKLARRGDEKEAMLETRGDGGLLFVYPTPGYEITAGNIFNIPEITQETRDAAMALCRHFDEHKEPDTAVVAPTAVTLPSAGNRQDQQGKTPLDDYNAKTDMLALAESYGWTVIAKRGDYVRLNRPNAKHKKGVDASVITSKNIFYPFTSSEVFDPNKAYSPAAFYTYCEHSKDFSAAAKALFQKGFGELAPATQGDLQPAAAQPAEGSQASDDRIKSLVAFAETTRFKLGQKSNEPTPMLTVEGKHRYKVAGRGMIGVFTGHEKSGKSFVLSCIGASAFRGRECLNFNLDLDGGKLLWFDTEQSGFFYEKTQERIFKMAEIGSQPLKYDAFHLRRLSPSQRLDVIEHYVYNTPDISCLVIDGFVDLITDYNDLKLTQEYVQRLMRWSDERQILIMGVLHVNKGDGKIRGHIGSEIKNKCDFVVNTARADGGFFTITNPTSRYGQFPDMDFTREEGGMPKYRSFYEEQFQTSNQFPTASAPSLPAPDFVSARPGRDADIPF